MSRESAERWLERDIVRSVSAESFRDILENYLKMKGFTNDELVNHFEKIEEMNQNINDILAKNPNAILKKIDFNYLDEEKTKLNFEINIEVVNR